MEFENILLPDSLEIDSFGNIQGWDVYVANEHPMFKRKIVTTALHLPNAASIMFESMDDHRVWVNQESIVVAKHFPFTRTLLFQLADNAIRILVDSGSENGYFFTLLNLERDTSRNIVAKHQHIPYTNIVVYSATDGPQLEKQTWSPYAQWRNSMSIEPIIDAMSGPQKLTILKEI